MLLTKTYFFRVLFYLLVIICCSFNNYAQKCSRTPNTSLVVSKETYNKVLNLVFPQPVQNFSELRSYFILRFNPSSEENSQIVLKNYTNENASEIILYKTPKVNIYNKLNTIFNETCKENAEEMAKQLKVETYTQKISNTDAMKFRANFFANLVKSISSIEGSVIKNEKTGEVEIILDGTSYEVWADFGTNSMSSTFYNEEIDNQKVTGNLPIIRWMNQIRLSLK